MQFSAATRQARRPTSSLSQPAPTLLTRVVGAALGLVSPTSAMRWMHGREMLAAYNSARRTGPNKRWVPSSADADTLNDLDRRISVARCRDLDRNSPLVFGALNTIVNNVVQGGIRVRFNSTDTAGAQKLEREYSEWGEESGLFDFQELAIRHMWTDGGLLGRLWINPDMLEMGLPPLCIEPLEIDYLDTSIDGVQPNGNLALRGIEYSVTTKEPVAYHLFQDHPGASTVHSWTFKSVRVDASEIIHVFHKRRASARSGFPWLATVAEVIRDFDEYQSAERLAKRIEGIFSMFLKTPEYMPQSGAVPTEQQELPQYFEPGRIQTLPPGYEPNFVSSNRPGNGYEPYTKWSTRLMGRGFNMNEEVFANNGEKSSYAVSRSGTYETRRGYQSQQRILYRQVLRPVVPLYIAFRTAMRLHTPKLDNPIFTPRYPGWERHDPSRDSHAEETSLRNGLSSMQQICDARGFDFRDVVDQRAEELAYMKQKGVLPENYQDKDNWNGNTNSHTK